MNELESWRALMKDDRLHIGIGTITQLGLSLDGNTLRAQVNLLPENREVVCEVTWDDYTRITFPQVDDLMLVGFVDGAPDDAFVIRNLSHSDEPIALFAQAGNSIYYSRPGKHTYLGSDTFIGISKPDSDPTEPLVLGNVLVNGLTDLCNAFLNAAYLADTPMGPGMLNPAIRQAITQFMQTYLNTADSNILSQLAFTERGDS